MAPRTRQRALQRAHGGRNLTRVHRPYRAQPAGAALAVIELIGPTPLRRACIGGQRGPLSLAPEEHPPRHGVHLEILRHAPPEIDQIGAILHLLAQN